MSVILEVTVATMSPAKNGEAPGDFLPKLNLMNFLKNVSGNGLLNEVRTVIK